MKNKRFIMLVGILCLCSILSGCVLPDFPMAASYSPQPVQTAVPETQPEPAAEKALQAEPAAEPAPEPAPVSEQEPAGELFVSFIETIEDNDMPDNSGKKLSEFSYSTPFLRAGDGHDCSELNEKLAIFDELFYSGSDENPGVNALHEAALDAFSYVQATGSELVFPFYSKRTVSPERIDDDIVSLLYTTVNYTGGNESTIQTGATYRLDTAEELKLDDVADTAALRELFAADYRYFADMSNKFVLKEFKDDPAAVIKEGHWYLTERSFVILADSLAVTGNDFGVMAFEIPFDGHENIFRIAGRAMERSGKLNLSSSKQVEDGTFEIRDFIQCSDGMDIFLTAEGTIYDLTISRVLYSGGEFFVTGILWKAGSLTDAAIQLRMVIPEGMPDIMISYTGTDGTVYQKFVVESGLNGEISLINNISSVG